MAILINARLQSSRLPRKHLREINGKPILSYLIERLQKSDLPQNACIHICTGNLEDNKALSDVWPSVFCGSDDNIPKRQYEALLSYQWEDLCVSVDGDDILCSVEQINFINSILLFAIGSSVKGHGLPFGMNAFGYSLAYLKDHIRRGQQDTNWAAGWEFDYTLTSKPLAHRPLRCTLDYEEDFQFFKALIEIMGDAFYTATDQEYIDVIEENELWRINEKWL